MKNLIRTNTGGDLERNPNPLMHCGEFDPRQVHDHQHSHSPQSSCFAPKSEHPSALEHQQQQQQRLFPCGNVPHILPMATRSFSCSQLSGLVDYSSETIKQQQQQHHQLHHCKSEKHDEDGTQLSGKCQIHSSSAADGGADILVKTEFNEMQQSKSSPVHEVFEMTSSTFASTVTGSSGGGGGSSGSGSGTSTSQFHHDTGSPPLPLMEAANSSASTASHHLQHHHHPAQHQCSAHSYESYVYAGGSGGRVGMSSRLPPGTMNTTSSSSELSGGLYHCKSFFADSASGSGNSGIAAFYPSTQQQQQQSNGESCRDDSSGFPRRDSLDTEEKVVIAIKARKMPD